MGLHQLRQTYLRDEPPQRRYTEGFCGEFAMALQRAFGYEVVVLACIDKSEANSFQQPMPLHAMGRHGELYLDVEGVKTWKEVVLRWQRWCQPGEVLVQVDVTRDNWDVAGWFLSSDDTQEAYRYITLQRQDLMLC